MGKIARDFPDVIRKISDSGHEIGCHSDIHTNLLKQNPDDFYKETHIAIDSLEQIIGKKVSLYRAPAFSVTNQTKWALELLIELGITTDSSIFPASRSFGGFPAFNASKPSVIETPSGSIKEFPVSYATFAGQRFMFAGGGYFRLFPYSIIKQLMQKSDYNLAYFHIRDLDRKQKRVYSLRYFQSYYGINGAWRKFQKLINDFDFISIDQADKRIDWDKVIRIAL